MESAFVHLSVDFIFSRGDKKKTARSCVTSEFHYDIYVKGYRVVWKLPIKDIFKVLHL